MAAFILLWMVSNMIFSNVPCWACLYYCFFFFLPRSVLSILISVWPPLWYSLLEYLFSCGNPHKSCGVLPTKSPLGNSHPDTSLDSIPVSFPFHLEHILIYLLAKTFNHLFLFFIVPGGGLRPPVPRGLNFIEKAGCLPAFSYWSFTANLLPLIKEAAVWLNNIGQLSQGINTKE